MKVRIRNFLAIESADIEISTINVVGGVNSSGKTTLTKMIYCHLKADDEKSLERLMKSESIENCEKENVKVEITSSFDDVFYIENISLLDLKNPQFPKTDHIRHILECLEGEKTHTSEISKIIRNTIKNECSSVSSAGIKQIGIIEKLLENGSLKKNSFLIIDEPESNLHPDWQLKFAEILVLLADELNVTLYLNTYSPIFIEAMAIYSEYYGLGEKTRFYLTQKSSKRFTFKKINPKNMGEIYENLTRAYDELDRLKSEMIFRK